MTIDENALEKSDQNPPSSEQVSLVPKHKEKKPSRLEEMNEALGSLTDPELKLNLVVDYMESSISQEGSPDFKVFWEARNLCLEFLKEPLAPQSRALFWTKYRDLSKEARRLKDILDKESDFTAEQIALAIQDLETELNLEQIPFFRLEGLEHCRALSKNRDVYEKIQSALNHLNTIASRINAFRKELIKTEMRIRTKNKFFQQLSTIGDHIFPKRKELIKEISQQFSVDVENFIQRYFTQQGTVESIFTLRDEIKNLQQIAKILTLNTQAFNSTRLRLSECWDALKASEKERKKHFAEKKAVSRQNSDPIRIKIQTFIDSFLNSEITIKEGFNKLDEFADEMRKTELDREDVKSLRELLNSASNHLHDKMDAEEKERSRQEDERQRQKQEKIINLKTKMEELISSSDSHTAELLMLERDNLTAEIQRGGWSKADKQDLDKFLRQLKDLITEKKEKALLSLPQDKREALTQLQELLTQRKERRQQIKSQLELMKKTGRTSGLDIGRAMEQNQLIQAEKERLEKANQGVKEIEDKITEIEDESQSVNS